MLVLVRSDRQYIVTKFLAGVSLVQTAIHYQFISKYVGYFQRFANRKKDSLTGSVTGLYCQYLQIET